MSYGLPHTIFPTLRNELASDIVNGFEFDSNALIGNEKFENADQDCKRKSSPDLFSDDSEFDDSDADPDFNISCSDTEEIDNVDDYGEMELLAEIVETNIGCHVDNNATTKQKRNATLDNSLKIQLEK